MAVILLYFFMFVAAKISCTDIEKPHIVFITGDDIGWADISHHGSDFIMTPNIDMLGYQGIIIPYHYTDAHGTPTAGALLTGKYPMKLGLQGKSIGAAEDRGLPFNETLLPSRLQECGYVTHLVGKWPLGSSRRRYLPTNRGFDTFYGFTDGSVDYYTYEHMENCNGSQYYGMSLFNNLEPVQERNGQHLTKVLTDHAMKLIEHHDPSIPLYLHVSHAAAHVGGGTDSLQASAEDVTDNMHIAHPDRRKYAALVTSVDKSVGNIIDALSKKGMLNNTMIVFMCENGAASKGPSQNYGSNLPLRGTKGTPWEGSVRTTAVAWHAAISPKVWTGLFHITDWLPTLIAAAGGNITNEIDGINQWQSLINDEKPPRKTAIIAVDDLEEWGAYRDGDFKVIIGNVGNKCGYYGQELNKLRQDPPSYEDVLFGSKTAKVFTKSLEVGLDINFALEKRNACNLLQRKAKSNDTEICVPTKVKGCLFNISADPEEAHDLWDEYPEIVQNMTLQFRFLWSKLIPRRPPTCDHTPDLALNDYVWFPWQENEAESPIPLHTKSPFPMKVSHEQLKYFVNLNVEEFRGQILSYLQIMADMMVDNIGAIFKY